MSMKTTIACLPEPRKWKYQDKHYQAISNNHLQYYSNDVEGLVVFYRGVWKAYNEVRETLKDLPELERIY